MTALKEMLEDVAEDPEGYLRPGEKVVFHPGNFDLGDGEELSKEALLNCAFQELGFDQENPDMVREDEGVQYFKTNRPRVLLCFDGTDWWLELAHF